MKIRLIIFLYTLIYNSSAFAISDAAGSALFGGLIYAVVFGVGFGICYYIFINIFGFFKKAANNNSVNNSNQQRSNNINTQSKKYTQIDTNSNIQKQSSIKIDDNISAISNEEEEEIYVKASREFLENRKEGIWTKALIQTDGDENKAKITYMKLRVEQLKEELKESKIAFENKKFLKAEVQKTNVDNFFKKNFNSQTTTIEKLEFLITQAKENKIQGQELILTAHIKKICDNYSAFSHRHLNKVYDKLNKLVSVSNSEKNEDLDTIKVEEIEKIVSDKFLI